jgi:hypothetical protein
VLHKVTALLVAHAQLNTDAVVPEVMYALFVKSNARAKGHGVETTVTTPD